MNALIPAVELLKASSEQPLRSALDMNTSSVLPAEQFDFFRSPRRVFLISGASNGVGLWKVDFHLPHIALLPIWLAASEQTNNRQLVFDPPVT